MQQPTSAAPRSDADLLDLSKADRRKRLFAVGIGNFMEWFDFAIYGYFAAIIGATFFPSGDPTAEMLSSLAVFAVGFISRPVGALFLGPIGDKFGRRTVLIITVLSMGIITTLIGLTPSFEQIGVAAPIIVVALRLLQGMMVGGEWTSAAAYIGESAPKDKRAQFASVVTATAGIAFLVGTIVAAILQATMSEAALSSWGWRVPFLFSLIMAIVAVYIRQKLEDTPVYEEIERKRATGTIEITTLGTKFRAFVLTLAFAGIFGVGLYYFVTYSNNHLTNSVGMERLNSLLATGSAMVVYVAFNPLVGRIADRIGRRPVLLTGVVGLLIWAIPAFMLMNTGVPFLAFLGLTVFSFFVACCAVMCNVLLVEVFPASVRSTGSSLGYNISYALLAGPGPLIAAWLVASTGSLISPAYYVMAVAVLALVVLVPMLKETRHVDISHG
ncbi:MFS transporter [Leucobacter sp. USHLN153]|uniref:MFS transporter n=1 Tax=Leucobacter sp. USHLN153 TaxID=3081268 RepID=UPI00301B1F13